MRSDIRVMGVEVEGPPAACNFAAVSLDGSDAVAHAVAGSNAEVPVAEYGGAVARNDQVDLCPKTLGQGVEKPVRDAHLTIYCG